MHRVRVSIRRKLIFATLAPLCAAMILCWMIGSVLITDRSAALAILSEK